MAPVAISSDALTDDHKVSPAHPVDKKLARRTRFQGAWSLVRGELLDHFRKVGMPKETIEWYQKVSCNG